jgi:hypothetical protein
MLTALTVSLEATVDVSLDISGSLPRFLNHLYTGTLDRTHHTDVVLYFKGPLTFVE